MKFTCDKNLLIDAITNVQKAISTRTTMPILEGILFDAENNLILTGYDMETAIKYTMPAKIEEQGKVVLNSKIIGEIVKKAAAETISFDVENNYSVLIQSGLSKFKLHGLSAEDYPALVENDSNVKQEITLPQNELYSLIKKSIFSVSLDEKRPNLNGCFLKKENKVIEMVGIDGFRVSVADFYDANQDEVDISFIIPHKTLRNLLSMLEGSGNILISKKSNQLIFDFGRKTMISRIISENYINYRNIFPEQSITNIELKTKDLLGSIERSILMSSPDDHRYPVTIKCDSETMEISSINNRGDFHEIIDVTFKGKAVDVDINPYYLIDALKVIDDEKIKVSFNESSGPVIIEPINNKNFMFLILPLRK